MRISDMIRRLSAISDREGDLEIVCSIQDGGCPPDTWDLTTSVPPPVTLSVQPDTPGVLRDVTGQSWNQLLGARRVVSLG